MLTIDLDVWLPVAVLVSPSGPTSYVSVGYWPRRLAPLCHLITAHATWHLGILSRRLALSRASQLVIDLAAWPPVAVLVSPSVPTSYISVGYWPRRLAPFCLDYRSCHLASWNIVTPSGFAPLSWLLISLSGLLLQYWSRRLVIGSAAW